jgi:small conductance mechanosensitive channel
VAGIFIVGGGVVMLLDEAGIPIIPLMGGAAVLGLAVAFGAQNLIKDYFSGFMMLMEDQYGVNDVVRIGSTSGLVEKITLRITVLRDIEGVRHFIPHGSITNVSNMTHTWSRAMFDIPVAYGEDLDRAMSVLMDLAHEIRNDPIFGQHIIEDPEMLGVNEFDSSAIVIRFLIKTRPLKQWLVKREMLRRIKNRFDQAGIVIPFPHRTVYHKFPDGTPESSLASSTFGIHRAE